jgi:predicted outer membrane protein
MLRRIPWFLRVSVLVTVVLAVSLSVFQSWSTSTPGTGGWTQTQWGPLGPADRDLLVKVRLAGLWEAPTGQQASQQGSTPQVRELGAFLATQHADLDAQVRQVADQLGVLLPTQANAQQQGWMKEISAATGADYDRIFVQRLREAHGIVLPIINQVRVSTRNDLIRKFADTSDAFVQRHMEHLEATGLVDYGQLPDPPSPGLFAGDRTFGDLIIPILVFIAALLGAIGLVIGLRRRAAARPVRVIAPPLTPGTGPGGAIAAIPAPIPAPRSSEISGAHRFPGSRTGGYALITEPEADTTHLDLRPDLHSDIDQPPALAETLEAVLGTRQSASQNTGAHRFPPVVTPGDATGPRRAHRRATVEATGPRHSTVRRS